MCWEASGPAEPRIRALPGGAPGDAAPQAAEQYSCTVVVPCKNEEGNVPSIPERVPRMGRFTEIVFVDDASTDATAERVREAIERHPDRPIKLVDGPGRGKGAAVRAGLEHATGDIFMILDADMTVMPEDLPAFFTAITETRARSSTARACPIRWSERRCARRTSSEQVSRLLFSFVLEQRITDTLCGHKVVSRDNYAKIVATRDYFGDIDRWGDYDWIFGAAKNNLKLVELPIHYVERTAGVTKMTKRFRNGLIMARMCWVALSRLRMA